MRVLLDGFWWRRGPHANRQVLRELVLGWARQFPADELVLAVQRHDQEAARAELPARVELVPTRLRPQGASAMVELPLLARRVRADVTLTHNFTPWSGRSCVFVHDLMFETNPEWFTFAERRYFSWMTRTVPRADLVLTSSRSEADRIERVAKPRQKVVPIGLGVPTDLLDAQVEPVPGLDRLDGLVLVVGRLNVRKNLGNAIEGALSSGLVSEKLPVVVAGERSGRAAELSPAVRAAVDRGLVRFVGFIPDAQLAWLYRHASAFVFMSLDEGFGIPALEAMTFGTPVVASDIPVFREILGTHAEFADPRDTAAIGRALAAVLRAVRQQGRDDDRRAAAAAYSWRRSVTALREAVSTLLPDGS